MLDRCSGKSACDDIYDSCLLQGNKRFWDKNREDVASKLWVKATAFGVGGGAVNEVFIGAIKEMENRDVEAKVQKEAFK